MNEEYLDSAAEVRVNRTAFFLHAILLAVTTSFTDINTVLPALILSVGGNSLHLGILTGIMVGVPLAGQLLFAGFLHTRPRKKPWLLLGIYLRVLALGSLTMLILYGRQSSLVTLLVLIYSVLMVFTLSGAFAGISYVDLIGRSFVGAERKRFVVHRQAIISVGTLFSALLVRLILGRMGGDGAYPLLFGLSALSLLLATGGFWLIREKAPSSAAAENSMESSIPAIVRQIPAILKKDHNLRYYIMIANLLGLGTVLLPFYMALGKARYSFEPAMIGNLVLIQITGMILSNLIWHRVIKARGFKGMLFVWSIAGLIIPPLALLVSNMLPVGYYLPMFLLTGMLIGAQKVTTDAVLLEISTDENRALYTGIFGTFNISLALFPILMGGIIDVTGFAPVFITVAVAALAARPLIRRMVCPVDQVHQSPLSDDIVRE